MSCRKESKILGLRNPGIVEYLPPSTLNMKRESTSQEKVNWGVGRIEKSSLVLSYIVTTSISTGAFRETAGYENFILNSKQW